MTPKSSCGRQSGHAGNTAHAAGAEVIKHQTHIVEDEISDETKSVIPGNADVPIYEIMERCALNEEDEIKLKDYVESKGMIFISMPFSRAAALRLERMNVPVYKIGSGECNNYPLIKLIASFGKPIILSIGMNTLESVKKSVEIICAAGAHALKLARGGKKDTNVSGEKPAKDFAFASVAADKAIKKGEKLIEENLWVKRPATGDFSADDYESLLGKTAAQDIHKGAQLKKADVQ